MWSWSEVWIYSKWGKKGDYIVLGGLGLIILMWLRRR